MGQVKSRRANGCSMPPTNPVVAVEQVIARKGSIPVSGRYSTTRHLENDYVLDGRVVGSGMSGPVRLATGKEDGHKYAVKSFKKRGLSSRKRHELKSEAEIYLTLDHPHIARLEMVYETEEELHLVMEYMAGGELYNRLSKRKRYTEEAAACAIRQVLLAVAYLHSHQMVHRDLKLENFLYESEASDHLKLIDFGFAKFWHANLGTKMSQACGSLHYVAPEVLEHAYTEKADIWSAGVIAYMLLTGSPPFFGSDDEVLLKIRAGKPHWSSRFHALSMQAKSFVEGLLIKDPALRLSATAALEHPFVQEKGHWVGEETELDTEIVRSLRRFAHASHFRRAVLSMMAWSLSAEDRAQLREQFLLLDQENRGTITHQELKRVLEENFHVDSAEAEELFSSLDTDHDDEIEYSEFLAAAMLGRIHVHEDLLRRTFARFDTHETGLITADDLRTVLGDHFEGADVQELIREADTSGDGRIDYDEFLAYFRTLDGEEPAELLVAREGVPLAPEEGKATSAGFAAESAGGAGETPEQPKRNRLVHIEKLGAVIDQLLHDPVGLVREKACGSTGSVADEAELDGPKVPRPLSRRTPKASGDSCLPNLLSPGRHGSQTLKPI